MKWFRHMTDASNDEFISDMYEHWEKKYPRSPLEGYGIYWRILEIIAAQMKPESDKHCTVYGTKTWQSMLRIRYKKLTYFVHFSDKYGKIKAEFNGDKLTLSCYNLLKLRDEYTKKAIRVEKAKQEKCTDSGRTVSGTETEGDTETEHIKEISKEKVAPIIATTDHSKMHFDPKYQDCQKQAKEVVDHFNAVTGKNAGYKGEGFKKIVNLLLNNEPIDGLKYVIDTKILDPDFVKWMTLRTLFGDKFYDYQSEQASDYKKPGVQPETFNKPDMTADIIDYGDGTWDERQPDGTYKRCGKKWNGK